ncbi:ammonium transporter 2-like [Bolinopsis microptera]|uniref:ammonium transporter 2-like n=1 Tax=Bolinopsis microptera TaxID=2820187 RepID=UPI003079C735
MSLTFKDGTVLDFQNQDALLEYIRVTADTASTAYSMDTFWLIICAGMVFLMQMGFALVEVGTVRIKNTKNILVKNMLDACIGALSFWLIGFALAFGDTTSGFIGTNGFALKTLDMRRGGEFNDRPYQGKKYALFLFQWAFAATAATIVSGAVAERCKVIAYFVYSFVLTVFVYPVVVHWGWSDNGWASAFAPKEDRLFGVGVIDFAGSSVVHMVGGLTALIGAIFLGPRSGKIVEGKVQTMVFQSSTFQTLGTLVLWFGWYGFNCGSTLTIAGAASDVAGKVAVTTTIGAASAGVTATLMGVIFEGHINIGRTNNGILAGLVSITAGCSVVDVEMAFLIGVIGGIVYYSASKLLTCLHIDDVVDASPVHLFCGIWGTIAAGLFAKPENVEMAYGTGSCGLFYKCDGNGGKQFGANLVFILAVIAWVGIFAIIIFSILQILNMLRVSEETEKMGLDVKEHGGAAYEVTRKSRFSGGNYKLSTPEVVVNKTASKDV